MVKRDLGRMKRRPEFSNKNLLGLLYRHCGLPMCGAERKSASAGTKPVPTNEAKLKPFALCEQRGQSFFGRTNDRRNAGFCSLLEESGLRPFGALQPQAPPNHKSIVGRDRLKWRECSGGLSLHYGHSQLALVRIEPDGKWRKMFRVRLPDGGISNLANLSRAKDAAFAIALRLLNSEPQETTLRSSHVRQTGGCRGRCGASQGPLMSPQRRNRISGQFSSRLIQMLELPAYRALSRSGHMVVSRIEIELGHHGGNDNGRLPVTTNDFVAYGMHRTSVAPAIREAEALGLIRITERGRGGNAQHGTPNLFFLTFAHGRDSDRNPPTHDWRHIKTLDEAEGIALAARGNKDPHAVANGKSSWRKRQQKKLKTSTETSSVSVRNFHIETASSPVRDNEMNRVT